MGNSTEELKMPLEQMPAAILAELFSSGIVVIPEEFNVVKVSKEAKEVDGKEALAPEKRPSTLPQPLMSTPVSSAPSPEITILQNAGEPKELTWLGNFAKQVLVVVQDPSALYVNDSDLALLTKILGAVGLSIADTAIVNAAVHALEYNALNKQLTPKVAFYFGIAPADIGAPIRFPHFQVQKWNSTTFLHAPALGKLNESTPEATALKKELWGSLKKIFN